MLLGLIFNLKILKKLSFIDVNGFKREVCGFVSIQI